MITEKQKLEIRVLALRKQFVFDRFFAFSIALIGLLFLSPIFMFLSGWFFLWTAFDAWRVGRAEKKLAAHRDDTEPSVLSNQE